jgi:hypothetical protein
MTSTLVALTNLPYAKPKESNWSNWTKVLAMAGILDDTSQEALLACFREVSDEGDPRQ